MTVFSVCILVTVMCKIVKKIKNPNVQQSSGKK